MSFQIKIMIIKNSQICKFVKSFAGNKTERLTEPSHDKTNNVVVRPAKTQIRLGDQSLRCPHEESFGP